MPLVFDLGGRFSIAFHQMMSGLLRDEFGVTLCKFPTMEPFEFIHLRFI